MCAIFDYYQYKKQSHTCPKCGWVGSGESLEIGEVFDTLYEVECPHCYAYLGCVPNPNIEQAREHWSELPDQEKHQLGMIEAMCNEFDRRWLKGPEQLPDIAGDSFTLIWDMIGEDITIRNGNQVVFTEPSIYQGYERFEEVVSILKERYGDALKGVVPTKRSLEPLCGDKTGAASRLEKFHEEIFGSSFEWLSEPHRFYPNLQNLPEDPAIRPMLEIAGVPRHLWPDGVIDEQQAQELIRNQGQQT